MTFACIPRRNRCQTLARGKRTDEHERIKEKIKIRNKVNFAHDAQKEEVDMMVRW